MSWRQSLCLLRERVTLCRCPCISSNSSISSIAFTAGYSCENAMIWAEDSPSVSLSCTEYGSCSNTNIYGDRAGQIAVSCFANSSSWSSTVCDSFSVHGDGAEQVTMHCIGEYACSPDTIFAANADRVAITAVGADSLSSGTVYAQNVSIELLLHFESVRGDESGVEGLSLYVPDGGRTKADCIGFGCHNIDIYAVNGIEGVGGDVTLNGCSLCVDAAVCIGDWNLFCGVDYATTTTFTGGECKGTECGCSALKGEIEESWSSSFEDESCGAANFSVDIECGEGADCAIHCGTDPDNEYVGECESMLIYGGKATSLTVQCGDDYGCYDADIYCPQNGDAVTECNVLCSGYSGCSSLTIYGNDHSVITVTATDEYAFEYGTIYGHDAEAVHLNCSSEEACYAADVYASNAKRLSIECLDDGFNDDRYDDEYWNESPCSELTAYAEAVTKEVALKCVGEDACYYLTLNADRAESVVVTADDGEYGMEFAEIVAPNASSLELTCIGRDSYHGCYFSDVYPPSRERLTINCYGYGCYGLHLYEGEGMDALQQSHIELNSCGLCQSAADCVSFWYIYCHSISSVWTDSTDYDSYTVFDGESCRSYSSHCQCAQNTDLLQNAFSTDLDDAKCADIMDFASTASPGARTTADHGGKNQEGASGHNGMKTLIAFIFVILMVCIGLNILYCYRRKKMDKEIAHERLEEEEGGDAVNEIAVQQIPQHIRAEMEHRERVNAANQDEAALPPQEEEKGDDDEEEPDDGRVTGAVTGASAFAFAAAK